MIIEPDDMLPRSNGAPPDEVEWMLNTQMIGIQNGFLERLRLATASTNLDARLALQDAKHWAALFFIYLDCRDKRRPVNARR